MRKILIGIFLIIGLNGYSQDSTLIKRMDGIDSTLRVYGKQQSIANKITIVSIVTISLGTIIGIPAEPLLIVNTVADLVTILITSKSNRKLSQHRSK
jgi:formate hydrogenlyase subunit 3/multisubunit Na+/H+ antiporter MnhD subunit